MAKLGDIFNLQMGKTPSRANKDYWNNGNNPWVSIADLSGYDKYVGKTKEQITNFAVQESGIKLVPPKTLLMSFKLSVGKTAITNTSVYTNEAIMAFIPTGKYDIYIDYFFYLFSYKDWFIGSNRAVMGATLNKTTLNEIEIIVPPISEQRRIASILDKVTDLITKRRTQLEKLDLLVKSRFVEMFGDINLNNKGWEMQRLGTLCTIVRGGSPRPIEKYLGGSIPWIKIGDATEGEDIYLCSTKDYIIPEGIKKSRMVNSGSLIFANCGVSLGFARIITFDGCIHDGWLALQNIDSKINKIFLLQCLNQMTEHFRQIAPAGTQPNLNTSIMKSHQQIVPPIKLQNEYVDFLLKISELKVVIAKSLKKMETLKKALMQKYFG